MRTGEQVSDVPSSRMNINRIRDRFLGHALDILLAGFPFRFILSSVPGCQRPLRAECDG